jgi:hypothetical protein
MSSVDTDLEAIARARQDPATFECRRLVICLFARAQDKAENN